MDIQYDVHAIWDLTEATSDPVEGPMAIWTASGTKKHVFGLGLEHGELMCMKIVQKKYEVARDGTSWHRTA